jgi:hypothetical protein
MIVAAREAAMAAEGGTAFGATTLDGTA